MRIVFGRRVLGCGHPIDRGVPGFYDFGRRRHRRAGNGNPAPGSPLSRVYDGTTPTVTLTSDAPDPTNQSPFTVVATFSEQVTGFAREDIVVTNGAAVVPNTKAVGKSAVAGSQYEFELNFETRNRNNNF